MRAPFQEGSFPAPVKYGYINVGVIEAGPAALVGRPIFALYPHQTRYVVPASAVHALPEGLPARRALLAANMETALNIVWDAKLSVGDRIAVIGGGVVGCLAAWIAGGVRGCQVELVDINPSRRPVAGTLGVEFAAPEAASGDADVVIHASGSAEGLQLALTLAAFEARIVEASWYGSRAVSLPLGHAFHSRRLTLTSSQVGTIAGPQRARWDTRRRMALALDLLKVPALDVLLDGRSAFDDLPRTMIAVADRASEMLCHCVDYADA